MRPLLTVMTDPIPVGRFCLKETLKRLVRPIRDLALPRPAHYRGARYRGHPAVTRSLVEGLEKIGVSANYNPTQVSEVASTVIVVSGLDALRQAILWKRRGRIARLLAGPNLFVYPAEHADVIAASEVDLWVVPSDWVCRYYVRDCPSLAGRCVSWPAGVNTAYWCPDSTTPNPKDVLVFYKHSSESVLPVEKYVEMLEQRCYRVTRINYGSYTREDFLSHLRRSSLLIGFSDSETQGIAWAEAWSVGVPTLLWFQDHNIFAGRTRTSSTAPYLSDRTGLFFSDTDSFEAALARWEASRATFQPRSWVLDHMSDEVCARLLCELAGVTPSM